MSEMIERVGRALQKAWDDAGAEGHNLPPIRFYRAEGEYLAATVVKAMREPSEAVTRALYDSGGNNTIWQSAIDAALVGEG